MLKWVGILLVLNFDAFVSGLALGVAAIRVRLAAGLLVAAVSAGFFGVSLVFGAALLQRLPMVLLHRLGLVILAVLTLLWLVRFCGKNRGGLGGIWRQARQLDSNEDKYLSLTEAALLALALALDSLGGGLAFGLLGQSPLLWSLVSAMATWLMFAGANFLGREVARAIGAADEAGRAAGK